MGFLPVFLLFICAFLVPIPSSADDDGERAELERLVGEIDALKPIMAEAEAKALPGARVRFNYKWLGRDLDLVKSGIREHIEAPRSEPRPFPPLSGDYRR
ncbi:RAQPRD family integrative conjugative element protein [Methyloterricola oryzae]|uniref:integrative conjugative element protein, RAQPRD family n=1 Tax=Methyloterricola oryzae TaxID=1495050 RepID=UPI0005EB88BC|nr:RAQPRD family integrative conjugative element protein [Methyloterricola oryzae]